MPHRRIIYYGRKNQRAATRYHNMKTVRLEREFFVPISTFIAALTPAQLIHGKFELYMFKFPIYKDNNISDGNQ